MLGGCAHDRDVTKTLNPNDYTFFDGLPRSMYDHGRYMVALERVGNGPDLASYLNMQGFVNNALERHERDVATVAPEHQDEYRGYFEPEASLVRELKAELDAIVEARRSAQTFRAGAPITVDSPNYGPLTGVVHDWDDTIRVVQVRMEGEHRGVHCFKYAQVVA
jgi:hypothetical protein